MGNQIAIPMRKKIEEILHGRHSVIIKEIRKEKAAETERLTLQFYDESGVTELINEWNRKKDAMESIRCQLATRFGCDSGSIWERSIDNRDITGKKLDNFISKGVKKFETETEKFDKLFKELVEEIWLLEQPGELSHLLEKMKR